MKTISLALLLFGLLTFTVHAQQTVVINRPGLLTDLASATAAIVALPLTAVEGIVVGTVEAAGSLIHGSTEIVVMPPSRTTSDPKIVAPAPVNVTPPAVVLTKKPHVEVAAFFYSPQFVLCVSCETHL